MEDVQVSDVGAAAQKIKEGAVEFHSALVDHGQEKFEALCKSADETICANPYRSVAIAFGIGALLGIVIFRK